MAHAAPEMPKRIMALAQVASLTSTKDPCYRFYAASQMVPLALRLTPSTEFDFTAGNETYVLSMEDDTVKISTNNTAVSALNKTAPLQATFASGTVIAAGSYVEIVLTLGGTTPVVPALSVYEFEYLEG